MELKSHHIALTTALVILGGVLVISTLFGGSALSLILIAAAIAIAFLLAKRLVPSVQIGFERSRIFRFFISALAVFEVLFYIYFYCEFLKKTVLTRTPSLAICILFSVVALGIAAMGVGSLIGAASFITPFVIAFYLALLGTNLNFDNVDTLTLAMGGEIGIVLAIASIVSAIFINPILFIPLMGGEIQQDALEKGIGTGILIGGGILLWAVGTGILSLGSPLAEALDFPFYYAASIAKGGGLRRFESVISLVMLISGASKTAAAALVLSRGIGIKNK